MLPEFNNQISAASWTADSDLNLHIGSTLQELPSYSFQVEISCTSQDITQYLEKHPLLPGVILLEDGKYIGMISRQRLLEFLIRPYGQELFFREPLSVIYSYTRTPILLLPETTPILTAMQQSLRRSPELLAEPIVVHTASDTYKLLDVQKLNLASWQIQDIETQARYERSQAKMIQADKMASLGRLVDGVVHEILDPVSFIWGNLTHVATYTQDLLKLIAAYETEFKSNSEQITTLREEIEFDFIEQDLSQTLASIRTGAERLKKLVTSLQNFCYIDEVYPKPADLHACIDSIVLLINSRVKGEIEIIKHYGHLPPVCCFMGQLNQVLMNILSQSVDALLNASVRYKIKSESGTHSHKPRIEITTEVISLPATNKSTSDSRWVSICIADNGPGMSEELQQRIWESFTIEQRADKETSLAVSYRIITARHGGKFYLRSHLNAGTEFKILLPLV
ncbi:MAG TPA: ATP-binding protein [Nostocaceae cyanobacterium]|nr:ATP-binding protein [Nostocaceae cyanobacterium]